jgi:hypothetical protein
MRVILILGIKSRVRVIVAAQSSDDAWANLLVD